MKAFVAHGIRCHRPIVEIIQDVKQTGMQGIVEGKIAARGVGNPGGNFSLTAPCHCESDTNKD